jgi:histidinol-phosphatase (PHP family)
VIVDYHMHLRRPRADREEIDHTVEAVEPYVERARERGVDEIGFTEHVYYFRETRSLWQTAYQLDRCVYDLERYVDAVFEAKRRGLPVKLGLEVDYVRGREEETRDILAPYPWDYLLGSVHFIGTRGIDGPPRLLDDVGVDEAWRRYFDELAAAARSGLFDVLAHPDLVKMWGVRPERPDYEPLLAALDGVCLEISSAGLRKPVGELYPAPELLGSARERGVQVTFASDAHLPDDVGRDFDRVVALASEAGYDTVTVFDGRSGRQERFA